MVPSSFRRVPQPYSTAGRHERHDISTGGVPDQDILDGPWGAYYWRTPMEQGDALLAARGSAPYNRYREAHGRPLSVPRIDESGQPHHLSWEEEFEICMSLDCNNDSCRFCGGKMERARTVLRMKGEGKGLFRPRLQIPWLVEHVDDDLDGMALDDYVIGAGRMVGQLASNDAQAASSDGRMGRGKDEGKGEDKVEVEDDVEQKFRDESDVEQRARDKTKSASGDDEMLRSS